MILPHEFQSEIAERNRQLRWRILLRDGRRGPSLATIRLIQDLLARRSSTAVGVRRPRDEAEPILDLER